MNRRKFLLTGVAAAIPLVSVGGEAVQERYIEDVDFSKSYYVCNVDSEYKFGAIYIKVDDYNWMWDSVYLGREWKLGREATKRFLLTMQQHKTWVFYIREEENKLTRINKNTGRLEEIITKNVKLINRLKG